MPALLEVRNLTKTYHYRTNFFFKKRIVEAVKPLSFSLNAGETISIIGGNSSGKSTIANMIAGVEIPTSGEILVNGEKLHPYDYETRCKLIRIIFQNANASLNPRLRIGSILEGPLKRNTRMSPYAREVRIKSILKRVGLLEEHADFYPRMLAAGQRQRACIARALILQPSIIVADEALRDLDLSMRSQIINLLLELQDEMALAYIFVSQHLGLVKHISDQLIVFQGGQVIEQGQATDIFAHPQQEFTKKLLDSHFIVPSREKNNRRDMHTPHIDI